MCVDRRPYVGVTGFMSRDEVEAVITNAGFSNYLPGGRLMVGVLLSDKTLYRGTNKHPNIFPKVEDIANIFTDTSGLLNLLHYSTHSSGSDNLRGELFGALRAGGPNCNGFQLNIAWPDHVVLREVKHSHPEITIVLQIGSKAFELVGNSPAGLVGRLREYVGVVDYILLDPSGGLGFSFDHDITLRYIEALVLSGLDQSFGIGVAGGLHSGNLDRLSLLMRIYPQLSFDAQGQLRDAEGNLDLEEASLFVLYGYNLLQIG